MFPIITHSAERMVICLFSTNVNLSSCPPGPLINHSQTTSTASGTVQISITLSVNAGGDVTVPYLSSLLSGGEQQMC